MAGAASRGGVPNYRLYQCADGLWFFLGTLTPQFFLMALEATDLIHLMAMEGVEGEISNLCAAHESDRDRRALDARFAEKPRAEWLRDPPRPACRAGRSAHRRSGSRARPWRRTTCASSSITRSSAAWRCPASP